MTKEEIGKIINPKYPWVYGPTTAATKLLFKDGSVKVGYFHYIESSLELEASNQFSFVEFNQAQYYRSTGDNKYITYIKGDDLIEVVYPAYDDHDVTMKFIVDKVNQLRDDLDKRGFATEMLLRSIGQFRLDWGIEYPGQISQEYTLGATKQVLIEGLAEKNNLRKHDYPTNKIIAILREFIDTNQLTRDTLFTLYTSVTGMSSSYRVMPVTVHRRIESDFEFTSSSQIAQQVEKLFHWYQQQSKQKDFHPLLLAAIFHYEFVAIHPFEDGNGRMARILTSMILLRNKIPPPIIDLEERVIYISALQKTDAGDIEAWVKFLGKKLIVSMERLLSTNQHDHV